MADLIHTHDRPELSVELKSSSPQVGFPVSALSKAVFTALISLYADTVGADKSELTNLEMDREYWRAVQQLTKGSGYDWRLGSQLSADSKFKIFLEGRRGEIKLCYISCHANVNNPGNRSVAMQNIFVEAADKLLRTLAIAVERPIYEKLK